MNSLGMSGAASRQSAPASLAERLRVVGRAAPLALYHELALAPKPGLVSFVDTGSHDDMDANTFLRSVFALRSYFGLIAQAGAADAPMSALERLGQEAEARMLAATGGVNTHRGAVFALGMLCAAAGRLAARDLPFTPEGLRESVRQGWGPALRERADRAALRPALTNGQRAARTHGLRSAGAEAADAFPVLFTVTVPALLAARAAAGCGEAPLVQALFATMAVLEDTNLAHRGGLQGLRFAQAQARAFLDEGGVLRAGWRERAQAIHRAFVGRRLSPGGAADLLGCAWWVAEVCKG